MPIKEHHYFQRRLLDESFDELNDTDLTQYNKESKNDYDFQEKDY